MATKISYLDEVLNVYSHHCNKVSPGCKHCYAERLATRWGNTFRGTPQVVKNAAAKFQALPTGKVCGVNFMSDTFHEGVHPDTIAQLHTWIASRPDCVFIYTTKRSERLMHAVPHLDWPDNLWVGVSVENDNYTYRIDHLRHVPAHRWVSFEPLLDWIPEVDLTGIEWVVTGGESGKGYRYMDTQWALDIGEQAKVLGIPWYHKQGNAVSPDRNRQLHGKVYDAVPAAFHVAVEQPEKPVQMGLFD